MGENWHHLGDLGYDSPEVSTPPSHTYDIEYRFLVMHNLLRLFPDKLFLYCSITREMTAL